MADDVDILPWCDRRGGETGIDEYDGNPFIACLPPPPSERDCFEHLVSRPPCTEAERTLAPHLREQLAFIRMKQAFFPTGVQLRQAMQIDLLLRGGYVARNPSSVAWQAAMSEIAEGGSDALGIGMERRRSGSDMAADSMAALGPSGIGKTTVLRRMLDGYPQVVRHGGPGEDAITQIVWLRIEAAADGSTKQTILSMFAQIDLLLGTKYVERHGKLPREQMLVKAQQICTRHAIGLIAVDEIQNLGNSHAGRSDMMSFLTSLVNVVNVPILMIGTMMALPMMTSCFRTARRGEGSGSIVYEPMPNDAEWGAFSKSLFRYQWTVLPTAWSQEVADALWEESQGIIDIAVKLFVLSQMRAIRLGAKGRTEQISKGLVQAVAKDSLKLVRPMLDALRRKDWKALADYEDLGGLDAFIAAELQRNWTGAVRQPDLDALAVSLAERLEGPGGEVADSLMAAALTASGVTPSEMDAVMAAIAKARASINPAGVVMAVSEERPPKTKSRRPAKAPATDANDVRLAANGDDPLAGLEAAGLLDVA